MFSGTYRGYINRDLNVTAVFAQEVIVKPDPLLVAPEIVILLTIGSKAALFNDVESLMDVAPFIKPGVNRTMIPVRFISEYLGASVQWLPETKQVNIIHRGTEVVLTIGSDIALVNGEEAPFDCPAEIMNSRTFVPLRFVSEMLGAGVQWDGETRTITITLR